MLKNNKINMILALIIAVVLWGYVIIEVNPNTTNIIRDVPIQFVNEDRLIDAGYEMVSCDYETVAISYAGRRTNTAKVSADDFRVTVDLKGMTDGVNDVTIKVSGPDGINIDTSSLQKVVVTVKKLEEKSVKLKLDIVDEDKEIKKTLDAPKEITIIGKSNVISEIDEIKCETINISGVSANTYVELEPILPEGIKAVDEELTLKIKIEEVE